MSLDTKPYKGARDFFPEDKRLQKYIFQQWRKVCESFGYEEYDAPLLEPLELYTAKTSEEIVNEQTYSFEDRGGRKVVIRPEMTPTVSRMVAARRQELQYPVRWYSIPNLWRYERAQRGRFREHWQLNVDLFGVDNIAADFEMINVSNEIMRSFDAKDSMYKILVSSRKLINFALDEYLGLTETQSQTMIRLIDRKDKMDASDFIAKIDAVVTPSQREKGLTEDIIDLLNISKLSELPDMVEAHDSVKELHQLLDMCSSAGIKNVEFDITLMRGFDYYTDIVFEVKDKDPKNNRSMFGGGRYDGLVAKFGVEPVPTVGFGMGEATMINFLEAHNLTPQLKSETDVCVVLIGDVYKLAQPIIKDLRGMGVNVSVDTTGRKLDKQLKTVDKRGVNYVLFMGQDEIKEARFKLKNLKTGEEGTYSLERLVTVVKDKRTS
ncbi:MAG: histidine--tRNA ligase [bacterium]|nr:histidine--tRNA ligase [bacterium]